MTKFETSSTDQYTVVILAKTATGEKDKICQIEISKDYPGIFQATTRSFATLKGVLDMASEMTAEAEKMYLKDEKNEKTHGG